MRKSTLVWLVGLLLVATQSGWAQPTTQPKITPIAKFKPPVVSTQLGRATGANAQLNAVEIPDVAKLPLRVWDAKGNAYPVVYYQVMYTRKVVTEDEATGEVKPAWDMLSSNFTQTPLPTRWINALSEAPKKDETIHFFDVIAVDPKGRRFFAPDLKITLQ